MDGRGQHHAGAVHREADKNSALLTGRTCARWITAKALKMSKNLPLPIGLTLLDARLATGAAMLLGAVVSGTGGPGLTTSLTGSRFSFAIADGRGI